MFFELRQLLVMRREERPRASFGITMEVFDDGPGDGEAIVGRGPTTHFVKDDQGTRGALGKDKSRLVGAHLEFRAKSSRTVCEAASRRYKTETGWIASHFAAVDSWTFAVPAFELNDDGAAVRFSRPQFARE